MLRALLLTAGCVAAWTPRSGPAQGRRVGVIVHGGRKATPLGRVSTREGKAKRVADIKESLEQSQMLFAVEGSKLTVKQISALRSTLPEDSKAMMVKNTLLTVAGKELGWAEGAFDEADLGQSNLWFLAGEDLKKTMECYSTWVKGEGLDKDFFEIKGGFMEGSYLDPAGVKAVADMPSKPELMARLAGAIQQGGAGGLATALHNAKGMPQGLAVRLKKAAGGKLATGLKISVADETKNLNV